MSHKPLTHSSSTRVNSDGLIRQIVSFSFCLFISQFEGFTETFEDIILVVQLRKKKKICTYLSLYPVLFFENHLIASYQIFHRCSVFLSLEKTFLRISPAPSTGSHFQVLLGSFWGMIPYFLRIAPS